MARGGLGWQTRASNPNLAQGRKVKLRTGKQLFTALPGMQEQSWAAGIGAAATGSSALKEEVPDPADGVRTLSGKVTVPPLMAAPLQQAATGMLGFTPSSAAVNLSPYTGGTITKEVTSLGQTMCVKLNLCMEVANTEATLGGTRDFLSPVSHP